MTKKKKNNKSKKLVYFVLGFISVVFIMLLTYYFVLPSVFSSVKETKNILIVSNNLDEYDNQIMLVHLSKNIDENIVVSIDGNQTIDIDSYGKYSLNTIYQLLKIDEKSDQEIKSLFSNILKISIDEVVVVNGIHKDNIDNGSLKNIFSRALLNHFSDLFSKNNIYLLKLHFLADSMEVFILNQVSDLKNIYYKLSTLDEITYQNCSVSVVNTTSKNGLAKKVSEMIENTGARVMQVEGSDSVIEKTAIYYQVDSECIQLVDRILGIFPARVGLKDVGDIPSTQQFRSNVVVMIGSNY